MQLNNTTQYAIRILNYINVEGKERLFSARVLSDRLDINYKFLTSIMTKLVKANFITSIRGRDGGFKLIEEAHKIFIIDVIELFDDSFQNDACVMGIDKCNKKQKCFMHDKWVKPKKSIYDFFENTSLADIANRGDKF